MFSDLAIAAETFKVSISRNSNWIDPYHRLQYASKSYTPKRAAELILSGELITAKEAETYGLINKAVPDDKFKNKQD